MRKILIESQVKKFEIIIVFDGKEKNTQALSVARSLDYVDTKIIFYEMNRGKGYALKKGIYEASGEILVLLDADFDLDISNLGILMQDYASQISKKQIFLGIKRSGATKFRQTATILVRSIIRMLFGSNIKDSQTGLKIFTTADTKKILKYCRQDGYLFELELILYSLRLGYTLHYMPILFLHEMSENSTSTNINLKAYISSLLNLIKLYKDIHANQSFK